jgi:hypothetical protein
MKINKKKRKTKKHKGGNNDFGFIFTRCVKNKEDNQIWKNCYKGIRKFYKEKIIIITDGSNKDLIENIELENVDLIDSEFKGAGEILPYYYFHKLRPFKKAICMQDSMWFMKKFDFKNYDLKDVVFLWEFYSNNKHFIKEETELASLMSKEVLDRYNGTDWFGCWGACSFITIDFVDKLEENYKFLKLVNYTGIERTYRHAFERIFGVICSILSRTMSEKHSLFGAFFDAKTTKELKNINNYKNTNQSVVNVNILKLFRGR